MNSSISVSGVSKRYRDTNALSDVTIEVKAGEFVSIIGRNAAGKSTLLKIVAGIIQPTSGNVHVEGETSYMPQDHGLLPWRTVEENLFLPGDIQGIPRANVQKRVRSLLAEFGLEQYIYRYPSALSGGTRQKVALLRSALLDRPLLLLDEPFAPLDALSRTEAEEWLQKLVLKTRASVLFVTHDIREALYLSDSIYVLGKGKVKERFSVPLPRPRTYEQLASVGALELEKKLLSLIVH